MTLIISKAIQAEIASVEINSRLLLFRGEIACIQAPSEIIVIAGRAWVSYCATDTILEYNQKLRLDSRRDFAVLSLLGSGPLILHILRF